MNLRRIALFLICAGITFVSYYSITFFLLNFVKVNLNISISIAYLISVSFHYIFNKQITFADYKATGFESLVKYVGLSFASYFFQIIVVNFSIGYFKVSLIFAMILGVLISAVFTFLIMNIWVFQDRDLFRIFKKRKLI